MNQIIIFYILKFHLSNKIIQIHHVAKIIQFLKKPAARGGQPFSFINS